MTNKSIHDYINLIESAQQGVAEGFNDSSKDYGTDEVTITFDGDIPSKEEIIQYCKKNYGFVPSSIDIEPPSDFRGMSNPGIIRVKQGVAEAGKNPHPETWHDVDKRLGKAVDKMSQAEKVKKGLAHPDTLKQKGVAEEQVEESTPEAIAKINQITRK